MQRKIKKTGYIMIICTVLFVLLITVGNGYCGQPRWVIVGDSIMSNVWGEGAQSKSLTAHLIPEFTNVVIHNYSSPGAYIVNAVGYCYGLDFITGYYGAKGVIITLGTNDYGHSIPIESFFSAYKSFIQHAQSLGLEVVCVSPIWRADEEDYNDVNCQLWVYRLVINWACNETGAIYLNGDDAVPHDMSYYGDNNGLHLNTEGHEVFTEWLVNQMAALGFW